MTRIAKQESLVLCEGYHDRAFWDGGALHLGCRDPGAPTAQKSVRGEVVDPWGKQVKGGQYAYRTQARRFLRVVPCLGKDKILGKALARLHDRHPGEIETLVLNVDADRVAGAAGGHLEKATVLDCLKRKVDDKASENADGDIELYGGLTKVSLLVWECADGDTEGVPALNTLERLVCASIVAAYPPRGKPINDWLSGRGAGAPAAGPKEHAWSHLAGWYAEKGCDAFYKVVWTDENVQRELQARLETGEGWRIMTTVCR